MHTYYLLTHSRAPQVAQYHLSLSFTRHDGTVLDWDRIQFRAQQHHELVDHSVNNGRRRFVQHDTGQTPVGLCAWLGRACSNKVLLFLGAIRCNVHSTHGTTTLHDAIFDGVRMQEELSSLSLIRILIDWRWDHYSLKTDNSPYFLVSQYNYSSQCLPNDRSEVSLIISLPVDLLRFLTFEYFLRAQKESSRPHCPDNNLWFNAGWRRCYRLVWNQSRGF